MGGFGRKEVNGLDLRKDLDAKISQKVPGMPYFRRNIQKPVFAEESFPMSTVF